MRSRAAVLLLLLVAASRACARDEMFEGPLGIAHSRDASGTAWQPDASPLNAVHFMSDDWMFMVHGLVFAGWDDQSSTRRGNNLFMSTNWGMLMAQRELAGGELTLRRCCRSSPRRSDAAAIRCCCRAARRWAASRCTTASIRTTLHGARRALPPRAQRRRRRRALPRARRASRRSVRPASRTGARRWAIRSRRSATTGRTRRTSASAWSRAACSRGFGKLEASWFNGREPDANRWDLDLREPRLVLRSGSPRIRPTNWSLQISGGRLHSPEQPRARGRSDSSDRLGDLRPRRLRRRQLGDDRGLRRELAAGRAADLRSAARVEPRARRAPHAVRARRVRAQDRARPGRSASRATDNRYGTAQTTLGYLYDFAPVWSVVPGLGAAFTVDYLGHDLERFYGERVGYGFMVFARLTAPRLARH